MSSDPGLFRTIYTTRALRRFKPDPIPDEVMFQVLDAAIRAPSGQNAQDWRFIIVRDKSLLTDMQAWSQTPWQRYLARFGGDSAAIDALPRSQRLSLRSVEHLVHHLAQAPAVILVLGLKGRHSTPGGSAFPAVQNLLLAAHAMGLAGSVFNFPLSHESELRRRLAIPDSNQIYCVLPIGYPTDRHGALARKPVADVAYLDRFGEAWPFAQAQPPTGYQSRWIEE
ncbi:MAG: nitroreductase family protein [Gammaproteobacteria bacterium]|nr:nitroreductase family protein [Gammaproteobacteria bacterium]